MSRPRVALTLGKLDGLHRGHQHILAAVARTAADLREAAGAGAVIETAAVVLHPHPATVLRGVRVPLLTDVPERLALLASYGIDHPRAMAFDHALAALEPEGFLDRLAEGFDLAALVVGPDFALGRGRSGNRDVLESLGRKRGFRVVGVEPFVVDGAPVSSGRVRERVEAGDIAGARRLLTRPPGLRGTVVHGAKRGRTLGYPTANLEPVADYVVPGNGIYAVRVRWTEPDGTEREHAGAASIGIRPQFEGEERSIEVYLLDFDGDLYGQVLAIEFLAFLRPEERFDGVDALVAQIGRDVEAARGVVLSCLYYQPARKIDDDQRNRPPKS